MSEPTGLRLSALPPVYAFTHGGDYVYGLAAVWLFQHEDVPHWFATDGYSAMLTPALLDETGADPLFPPVVQQRCYKTAHVKAMFAHVKHGTVIYDPQLGTLTSPDGIVIVPPYLDPAEPGEDPVVRMPDIERAFAGEEEAQSSFEFGWAFVSAIRAAFKAHSKDAQLTMTCLAGQRVRVHIHEPYQGTLLVALNRREERPAETDEDIDEDAAQAVADLPGVESVTLSSGGKSVTVKSKAARLKEKLREGAPPPP